MATWIVLVPHRQISEELYFAHKMQLEMANFAPILPHGNFDQKS